MNLGFGGTLCGRLTVILMCSTLLVSCVEFTDTGLNKRSDNNVNNGFMFTDSRAVSPRITPGSQHDFLINVGDYIFFKVNSAKLSEGTRLILDHQAKWLLKYSANIVTIEGHADERGTREYNLALGARRAAVARNYLISKGVPASRLRVISYGKERPMATCNDISCWAQNRRVVTVLKGS